MPAAAIASPSGQRGSRTDQPAKRLRAHVGYTKVWPSRSLTKAQGAVGRNVSAPDSADPTRCTFCRRFRLYERRRGSSVTALGRARDAEVRARAPRQIRRHMTRRMLARLAVVTLVVIAVLVPRLLGLSAAAQGSEQGGVPKFQADRNWPKLPNNWILGEVSSVAVDRRDHVWILHRPRTVPKELQDRAAPAVLEIDPSGNFVKTLGGLSD